MPTPLTEWLPADVRNRCCQQNLDAEESFQTEAADGFRDRLRQALYAIGIPPRLHKTEAKTIPFEIARLSWFQTFPATNFGLVGPSGCGKSCALVHQIKTTLLAEFTAAGPRQFIDRGGVITQVAPQMRTEWKWVGWPALAAKIKNFAMRRDWDNPAASTGELIQWITFAPERRVLVLDDVGEESMSPYPSEQLELLIEQAYDHECRVFWTSNHTVSALGREVPEQGRIESYGHRLMSRLTGLAPDAELPATMPDLRIRKVE